MAGRLVPRRIRFPGGLYVDVKKLPPSTLADTVGMESEGGWIGTYEEQKAGTIYLDKSASPATQWNTLLHEMIHAMIDIENFYTASEENDSDDLSDRVTEEPTDTGLRESTPTTRV